MRIGLYGGTFDPVHLGHLRAAETVREGMGLDLVAFLPAADSEVELVQPTTDDSGVARYLQKRGPGMHHICFEVDDLSGCLERLKDKGVRLINDAPLKLEDGKQIAFIHPESAFGVLVELYQY